MPTFWPNQGSSALTTINDLADRFLFGAGTPEGFVNAPQGSIYVRTDGGSGTTLYVQGTAGGTTGWRTVSTSLL